MSSFTLRANPSRLCGTTILFDAFGALLDSSEEFEDVSSISPSLQYSNVVND